MLFTDENQAVDHEEMKKLIRKKRRQTQLRDKDRFLPRIVKNKKKYNRKQKHKDAHQEMCV